MTDRRVAFDVTPLQNNHRRRGIGTYVRGLAGQLNRQDEVPVEFWGWQTPPFEVLAPHRWVGLPRPPMPRHRGAWIFARGWLLLAARRSEAPAIHVSDPGALIPVAGRHMMTTVHDLIPLREGMPGRRLERAGYQRYLDALRRTQTLFSVSPETTRELAEFTGRPEGEIILARVGIEAPPARDVGSAGGMGGSARDVTPHFLYIGGSDPTKNVQGLLAAMELARDLPERLVIAGQWTRLQHLRLAREIRGRGLEGRVTHAGFVSQDELERLLRSATAVVVPSLREGFGLPVAEAMARGVPVAHSDIEVMNTVSSGAAVTFDPASAADIAAALRRLSSDPVLRARLAAEGLTGVSGMTWEEGLRRTLEAYSRALR